MSTKKTKKIAKRWRLLYPSLKEHRKWTALWALLFAGIAAVFIYTRPIDYRASLTFMLNEPNEEDGLSLKQFKMATKRKSLSSSGDRIKAIMAHSRSRPIIQMALLEKVTIGDNTDFLANHIIRQEKLHRTWGAYKKELNDFFFSHDRFDDFNETETMAMSFLHAQVIGNEDKGLKAMFKMDFSKKTEILTYTIKSSNEELAVKLLDAIFKTVDHYFYQTSRAPRIANMTFLKTRLDSTQQALQMAEHSLARFQDANRNLVFSQAALKEERLENEISNLTKSALRTAQLYEEAQVDLKTSNSPFQLIDKPLLPLTPSERPSWIMVFLAGLLGGLLAAAYAIARTLLRDVMKEEKGEEEKEKELESAYSLTA